MKILYLDLGMGAAGDMLAGALLGLLPAPERAEFLEKLNALLPHGVAVSAEAAQQCGVTGLHLRVTVHGEEEGEDLTPQSAAPTAPLAGEPREREEAPTAPLAGEPEPHAHPHAHEHEHEHEHHHHHAHTGMAEIEHIVGHMALDDETAKHVLAVYSAVAAAESEVHGVPVKQVHFHELGALDAVADVTAAALLLRRLAPDRIVASPVAVGSGTVRCAHGLLPVPAPATALLLRGVPAYAGEVTGELCTPTGAALTAHYAADFGPMPPMAVQAVGYGFGTKEFPGRPNCVRAMLGETDDPSVGCADSSPCRGAKGERRSADSSPCRGANGEDESADGSPCEKIEEIVELRCNIDDMTAEDVGFALERLYAAGAVEAFTQSAGMKKNRPGLLLTALCRPEAKAAVLRAMLTYTGTIGVREQVLTRYALARESGTAQTALGPVRWKRSRGFGVEKFKWEHDDLERIAREKGMTPEQVRKALDADGSAD